MLTLLWVHIGGRARNAIDVSPLPSYTGGAVHDRYIAYFSYPCGHALCNAHILRQLQSVAEVQRQRVWTNPVSDLIRATKAEVDKAVTAGKTCLSDRRMRPPTNTASASPTTSPASTPPPAHGYPHSHSRAEWLVRCVFEEIPMATEPTRVNACAPGRWRTIRSGGSSLTIGWRSRRVEAEEVGQLQRLVHGPGLTDP